MQSLEVSGAVRPLQGSLCFKGLTEHEFNHTIGYRWGTEVVQWLMYCATNRKVAGSIPGAVSGFFIGTKSFRSHSASNRNEYQEYFLVVNAAGA